MAETLAAPFTRACSGCAGCARTAALKVISLYEEMLAYDGFE